MVDDHEDYETGAAPAAHKVSHQDGGSDEITVEGLAGELAAEQKSAWAKVSGKPATFTPSAHKLSHQNGGADEISVAGLNGELADDQPPKAHDLGGAKHNADTLANINAKVTGATLDDAGDPRDPNAHKLSHQNGGADKISVAGLLGETAELTTHKALPTIHQDAPGLIETHRLVAGAHHARYTGAEARALLSPIVIPALSFMPHQDDLEFIRSTHYLYNRTSLNPGYYFSPVFFPDGVTVTKVTMYGFRNDALAAMTSNLRRSNMAGGEDILSSLVSDWTSGWSSVYDDSILYSTVDNTLYSYLLSLSLDPNDNVGDVRLSGVKIEFTG